MSSHRRIDLTSMSGEEVARRVVAYRMSLKAAQAGSIIGGQSKPTSVAIGKAPQFPRSAGKRVAQLIRKLVRLGRDGIGRARRCILGRKGERQDVVFERHDAVGQGLHSKSPAACDEGRMTEAVGASSPDRGGDA